MKKLKRALIVFFLLLISFSQINNISAEAIRSIMGDWNNAVLGVKLSDGLTLMDGDDEISKREKRNTEILTGQAKKLYSVYDLYGGDIKFVPYFGEVQIKTNLGDKIYTSFINKNDNFKLTKEDVKRLFKSNLMSNNIAYKGRPPILDSQEVADNSKTDPRVSQFQNGNQIELGGITNIANFNLAISQKLISIISWLTGSELYNLIDKYWRKVLKSGLSDFMSTMFSTFLPLLIILFLYRITKIGLGLYKGISKYTLKELMSNLIGFIIVLGTIGTFLQNPMITSNTAKKFVNAIDNQFDAALNFKASPIVKSSTLDNVREAALWEKAVFNPWSQGTFQKPWNQTYTIADPDKKKGKITQSKQQIAGKWKGTRYNSYQLTNDDKIYVKLSNSNKLFNFAVYAMSLQSRYHISYSGTNAKGYVAGTKEQNKVITDGKKFDTPSWPVALTTVKNDQIYLDYFRLIDSQLNISPEYLSKKESVINNYTNSREWKEDFLSQSFFSLFYVALLIPLGILGIRKIKTSLQLIAGGCIIIYKSIMWFIKPEQNSIIQNYIGLVRPLMDYMWFNFMIYISITLYVNLVDKGLIMNLLLLIVSVYLLRFKRPVSINDIKYRYKQAENKIKDISKNGIEKGTEILNTYRKKATK